VKEKILTNFVVCPQRSIEDSENNEVEANNAYRNATKADKIQDKEEQVGKIEEETNAYGGANIAEEVQDMEEKVKEIEEEIDKQRDQGKSFH